MKSNINLRIEKSIKRQRTMAEILWSPISHKDHYVAYIYFNISELGSHLVHELIPFYMPNVWSFEYADDDKNVLYFPLTDDLKQKYIECNPKIKKQIEEFNAQNIDVILKHPSQNITDHIDKKIITQISDEIILKLKAIRIKKDDDSKSTEKKKNDNLKLIPKKDRHRDYKIKALSILLIMILVFTYLSW
jgi:hypothetical protein